MAYIDHETNISIDNIRARNNMDKKVNSSHAVNNNVLAPQYDSQTSGF